ncbi:DUF5684 domain-containing protein [Stieleria tagensis]|uniref:DUF5684 domain-containing protein n=1 Tax=Stieleria tagensis TaxID=2956795 RepID=UPI00209BAEF9|nr:DUF5684 domain-containing protein [Stieleria tagensis]
MNFQMLLGQQPDAAVTAAGGIAGAVFMLVWLALLVVVIAGLWKTFEKAGKPGWAALIPIYNMVILLEIAGKPIWWLLLYFIPFVNVVVHILVSLAVAENFGKDVLFGLGLSFLAFIFFPILGFGDAVYRPRSPAVGSGPAV